MTKQEKDIIMSIREGIADLDYYSVYHDDKYSDEVGKLLEILYSIDSK